MMIPIPRKRHKRHKPLASLLWLIPLISLSLVDPCFSAKVQHHNTMASLKQIKIKFFRGLRVDASSEGNKHFVQRELSSLFGVPFNSISASYEKNKKKSSVLADVDIDGEVKNEADILDLMDGTEGDSILQQMGMCTWLDEMRDNVDSSGDDNCLKGSAKANTDVAGLSALHGHGNADQGGGGEDGDGPKLLDLNLSSIQGGETLHQKVTSVSPIDFARAKTKVIKPGGNGGDNFLGLHVKQVDEAVSDMSPYTKMPKKAAIGSVGNDDEDKEVTKDGLWLGLAGPGEEAGGKLIESGEGAKAKVLLHQGGKDPQDLVEEEEIRLLGLGLKGNSRLSGSLVTTGGKGGEKLRQGAAGNLEPSTADFVRAKTRKCGCEYLGPHVNQLAGSDVSPSNMPTKASNAEESHREVEVGVGNEGGAGEAMKDRCHINNFHASRTASSYNKPCSKFLTEGGKCEQGEADVEGLAVLEDHGSTGRGNGVENGDWVGGEIVKAQTKACASLKALCYTQDNGKQHIENANHACKGIGKEDGHKDEFSKEKAKAKGSVSLGCPGMTGQSIIAQDGGMDEICNDQDNDHADGDNAGHEKSKCNAATEYSSAFDTGSLCTSVSLFIFGFILLLTHSCHNSGRLVEMRMTSKWTRNKKFKLAALRHMAITIFFCALLPVHCSDIKPTGLKGFGIDRGEEAVSLETSDSHSFEEDLKQLKKLDSHVSRMDGADSYGVGSADILSEVKEVVKRYLSKINHIQMHIHNDDKEAAAALIVKSIGNMNAFILDIIQNHKSLARLRSSGVAYNELSGDDKNFDEIPDSQLAEFIQPQTFDDIGVLAKDLLDSLDSVDLSIPPPSHAGSKNNRYDFNVEDLEGMGSSTPSHDMMKEDGSLYTQYHTGGDEFKFYSNPFVEFDSTGRKSSDPSGRIHRNEFVKQYPSLKDMTRRHKSVMNGGLSKMGRLGAFFASNEAVMAKHRMRQNALGERCNPRCEPKDWQCNCKNLFKCVNDMTRYDLAVLQAGGYIDTQPKSRNYGNFTVSVTSLSSFDADEGVSDKLARVQGLTNDTGNLDEEQANCKAVLDEMFTACEPSKDTCTNANVESFHLSTEQVCDAVNTATKLKFEVMGDEFDGFVDDDVKQKCNPLSFETCRDFVSEFNKLYKGRDSTKYPGENPMLDPNTHAISEIFDGVRFPTEYWYEKNRQGIVNRIRFPTEYWYEKNRQGIVSRTFQEPSISLFYLVNPTNGMALGLSGNDCEKFVGADDEKYGPLVEVIDAFHPKAVREQFYINEHDEIVSQACADKVITAVADTCEIGTKLALRDTFRDDTEISGTNRQRWRFRLDGSIRNKACPDLAISLFDLEMTIGTDYDDHHHFEFTFVNSNKQAISLVVDPGLGIWSSVEKQCNTMSYLMVAGGITPGYIPATFTTEKVSKGIFRFRSVDCPESRMVIQGCDEDTGVQLQPPINNHITLTNLVSKCLPCLREEIITGDCPWLSFCTSAQLTYGWPMGSWNVRKVDDMSRLFEDMTHFDGDLSGWDVSSVTSMFGMFAGASSFNGDVSRWDTSRVVQMKMMFRGASSFNGNVAGWDTSRVTNMVETFMSASSFNGDVTGWDTSSVTDMNSMFEEASSFNRDVSGWDISRVTDMSDMFWSASLFNQDLCKWLEYKNKFYDKTSYMFWYSGCTNTGTPTRGGDECCASCSRTGMQRSATTAQDAPKVEMDNDIGISAEPVNPPILEASLELETSTDSIGLRDKWKFNDDGTISNVYCKDKMVMDSESHHLVLQAHNNIEGTQKWKMMSHAAMLPAKGSLTQVWKAQFVEPPYNYALVPGFPGTMVEMANGNQCLESTRDPDLAKSAMRACDKSMSLLVGKQMSLGTLRSIAELVNNSTDGGARHMPGSCCFDTPTTSWKNFGHHYKPPMVCENPGPFHLGVSEEACANAGGQWFRNSCTTLKQCIDKRPSKFDLDSPEKASGLSTSYVLAPANPNFTHDTTKHGCLEFCASLPSVSSQTSGMLTWKNNASTDPTSGMLVGENNPNDNTGNVDGCICPYTEGEVPSIEMLGKNVFRSPPKFYIKSSRGTVLGLDENSDCTADELGVQVQERSVGSPHQQFRLSLDGSITSVLCPERMVVLDAGDCSDGVILKALPRTNTTTVLHMPFEITEEAISIIGCSGIVSGIKDDATLKSDYFALGQSGLVIGIVGTECQGKMDIELQIPKAGRPSQQFKKEGDKIASVMCPGWFIEVPTNDDCKSALRLSDGTGGTGADTWIFHENDTIESGNCREKYISIDRHVQSLTPLPAPSLASTNLLTHSSGEINNVTFSKATQPKAGSKLHLTSLGNTRYQKWTETRKRFSMLEGPFSLVNSHSGNAQSIGASNDSCGQGQGLKAHADVYSDKSQQFYISKHGSIFSLACPGMAIAININDCSDSASLQLSTHVIGDDRMKWTFNQDKTISCNKCPNMVIDIDSGSDSLALKERSNGSTQQWQRQNARILLTSAEDWTQDWTVEFAMPWYSKSDLEQFRDVIGIEENNGKLAEMSYYPLNQAFSNSFETFAKGLVIDDASDEDQCGHARQGLGFDKDHPFDTEVCREFHDTMCNHFFTGVDHQEELHKVTKGKYEEVEYEEVEYEAPEYSDDPDLGRQELKKFPEWSDEGIGTNENLASEQTVWLDLGHTLIAAEYIHEQTLEISTIVCDSMPENICAGVVCFLNAAKTVCNVWHWIIIIASYVLFWAASIAHQVIDHQFEKATLGPNEAYDGYYYSKNLFNNMEKATKWQSKSLRKINENIQNQHMAMRQHLQDRHLAMETNLGQDIVDAQNANGQLIVDAQNTLGNLIVDTRNEVTRQVSIPKWMHTNLALIYEATGGMSEAFIGPLEENQEIIPMNFYWPEGQPTLMEKMHEVEVRLQSILAVNGSSDGSKIIDADSKIVDADSRGGMDGKVENKMGGSIEAKVNKIEEDMKEMKVNMKEMGGNMKEMQEMKVNMKEMNVAMKEMKEMMLHLIKGN